MMLRLLFSFILFFFLAPVSFADLKIAQAAAIPDEGLAAEGEKDWQRAISIYLNYLEAHPERADLWVRVAIIEHQLKNNTLAVSAYKRAIQIEPNNPALHKALSEIYAELKQHKDALAEINEAVKLKPNDVDYLIARARIANWNQNSEIALESYERILIINQSKKITPPLAILLHIARLQNQLHHYPEAIRAYEQALKINPKDSSVYYNLSQTYAAAKEPEKAIAAINQALQLTPNNIEYLKSKAMLATWLKNNKLALETYQLILKLAPQNEDALKGSSQLTKQTNVTPEGAIPLKSLSPFEQLLEQANNAAVGHHYSEAAAAVKKAIILRPQDANLYKKLSEIYAVAKLPKLALQAINHALRIEPNNIGYLRARAKLAAWAGDQVQVVDSYEKILKLIPQDEDALLNIAHALAWQGRTDEAIKAYKHLLYIHPHSAEGWIQYAQVLSWIADYIGALNALEHYKQLKGETTAYFETKARILALIGRFKSALAINESFLMSKPNDPYVLSTEVTALMRANQTKKALYYLNRLNTLPSDDPEIRGLNNVILTPLKNNINVEGDYTSASDTTRIIDIPVSAQYFLTPSTSLLFQGLYERAAATVGSSLGPANGGTAISDESAQVGIATQIKSFNVRGTAGGLKIQNENNHGIYDALVNTNLGETAQFTVENLRNLFRPYLVPQSPRLISLQIMENRVGGVLQWQPFVQKYLNVVVSHSDLSDVNGYWHVNVWPKASVYNSERWIVTLGVDGDFWDFRRRASDGYYSPLNFNGYEGTIEVYFSQSENIGYSFSGGFGLQKDETFPHYFYEEDISAQMFLGIFTDWELRPRAGYTLRMNPTGNYHCWTAALLLTRRF